ncbi:MAG TPA: phosphotransferase [Micromonosporaceae bacterium]
MRIGGVVHKGTAPWTPSVHALLRRLESANVDGVPRVLGFDEQGRQMLTYLPGEVIGDRVVLPSWVYADSTLVQVGEWMRRIHDATAVFVPPEEERWFTGRKMRPGWIVGHQDAAPYNAVMDGDRLVGFFDWDTASPSPRDDDLGFSALLWVPLTAPDNGAQPRSHDVTDLSRRLHLLLDAYRYDGDRRAFGAAVVQRARRQAGVIRSMADAGEPTATALLPIARVLEQSASYVEALPVDFWTP